MMMIKKKNQIHLLSSENYLSSLIKQILLLGKKKLLDNGKRLDFTTGQTFPARRNFHPSDILQFTWLSSSLKLALANHSFFKPTPSSAGFNMNHQSCEKHNKPLHRNRDLGYKMPLGITHATLTLPIDRAHVRFGAFCFILGFILPFF